MFIRSLRRNFYSKFIIFSIVIICFLFYFKYITINKDTNSQNNNNNNNNGNNNNNNNNNNQNDVIDDISKYERLIRNDFEKQVPKLGDNGESVTLSGESKELGDKNLATIALNEELSEHLSYNRTTPDARNPLCRHEVYDLNGLPTATIIIIFFNEPYSVLIRTVHSVLNTGDKKIIKEIILVDDDSKNEELKDKLEYYIETRLPKGIVKLIRLKNRLGLIRARLAGARIARGDVLVFLDAHCEAVVGWLEPLLQRIQESRTSVLVPIIDVIDAKDFHYSINGYKHFQVGGFTWNGHFDWIDVSKRERERQRVECNKHYEICPTYSPTMAGGLFAISRDYFWEVGSYDEQMDGWGGENLEMSFRIWQCGGTIETIPCSRVGHIFRDFHPYSFPDNRDTHGINTVRMAIVWMDEYINLFYMNRPDMKNHPGIGDVTHRQILREKLKCKSFDWYLKNVYPEKFIPTKNVIAYGRVQAKSQNLCFDDLQQNNDEPYNMGIYACHQPQITRSQFFSFTNSGVLRNEITCATVQKSTSKRKNFVMIQCSMDDKRNEKWKINDYDQIIHVETKLCIDHKDLNSQDYVYVTTCDPDSETQKWEITH